MFNFRTFYLNIFKVNNIKFLIKIALIISTLLFFIFLIYYIKKNNFNYNYYLYLCCLFCLISSFLIGLYIFKDFNKEEGLFNIQLLKSFFINFSLSFLWLLVYIVLIFFDIIDINVYASSTEDLNEDEIKSYKESFTERESDSKPEISDSGSSDNKATVTLDNNDKNTYTVSMNKETVHKIIDTAGDVIKHAVEKALPSLGAASAGATVAATIIKTSTMNAGPRAALAVTAGTAMAGGVAAALHGANAYAKNAIASSELVDSTVESRAPSPVDSNFINSPNDITSPLQDLLLSIFSINIVVFILFIILLLLFLNKIIFNYNINFISSFITKYCSTETKQRIDKIFNKNKSISFNEKFFKLTFIIISISIIFFLIINIFFSFELLTKIEDYVIVYNEIHKKYSFLFFTVSYKYLIRRILKHNKANK